MMEAKKMCFHLNRKSSLGIQQAKIIECPGSIFSAIKLSYVILLCCLLSNFRTFLFDTTQTFTAVGQKHCITMTRIYRMQTKKRISFESSPWRPNIACRNTRARIPQCNYLLSSCFIQTVQAACTYWRDGESGQRSSASLRLSSAELGSAGKAG